MVDYRPQTPISTNSHISMTAQMSAPHSLGVVTWSSLPVVCCLPGTCLGYVLVKGRKADDIFSGTYVQNMAARILNPGKSSCPLPPENKFEGLPRAPHCTGCARTSTNVSGRASRVDLSAFCEKKFSYEEMMFEKVRKNHEQNSAHVCGSQVVLLLSVGDIRHARSCVNRTHSSTFVDIGYGTKWSHIFLHTVDLSVGEAGSRGIDSFPSVTK